jgi:glycosyltransferase involved in cell wall biosynthesis
MILHAVPGTSDVANGMVVVAKLLAKEQDEAIVVDLNDAMAHLSDADEVWVHGMWLPREWRVCRAALKAGKRLVRMTHGALSPVYLKNQSPLKKRLVSPIEKRLFRKASRIVATCEAEKGWIEQFLGKRYPPVEVTDIKRFFNLDGKECKEVNGQELLHLLYLGRRHPLKGLTCLEESIKCVASVELRAVDNAFGEEKEKIWDWCDVLVLPTLSENFGLVIAEALERGKRVITTDGAPSWGDGNDYGGRLVYLKGYRDGDDNARIQLLAGAIANQCRIVQR